MQYKMRIVIGKERADYIQNILEIEKLDFKCLKLDTDAVIDSVTILFSNSYKMKIKVLTGQYNAFINAILYNKNNIEINCDNSDCELLGHYEICDPVTDDTYMVELDIEEKLKDETYSFC